MKLIQEKFCMVYSFSNAFGRANHRVTARMITESYPKIQAVVDSEGPERGR